MRLSAFYGVLLPSGDKKYHLSKRDFSQVYRLVYAKLWFFVSVLPLM